MKRTDLQTYSGLMAWLAASFLAGVIGAQFEPGSWYSLLDKPTWTPPNWIFPVVWPLLYAMMGTAAWLVWKEYGFQEAREALTLFIVQLGLNAAWSWIFFGLHQTGTGFADIVMLFIFILFTIFLFWYKRRTAALLLIPYLFWVGYAAALNYMIWQLN